MFDRCDEEMIETSLTPPHPPPRQYTAEGGGHATKERKKKKKKKIKQKPRKLRQRMNAVDSGAEVSDSNPGIEARESAQRKNRERKRTTKKHRNKHRHKRKLLHTHMLHEGLQKPQSSPQHSPFSIFFVFLLSAVAIAGVISFHHLGAHIVTRTLNYLIPDASIDALDPDTWCVVGYFNDPFRAGDDHAITRAEMEEAATRTRSNRRWSAQRGPRYTVIREPGFRARPPYYVFVLQNNTRSSPGLDVTQDPMLHRYNTIG